MLAVFFHEMKQGVRTLAIWSIAVGLLVMMCMIVFPDMASQSQEIDEMFSAMGGFSAAFGMDRLSLSDPLEYYGVQAGAILGLGGAFFGALIGARMLSKEETEHTAEFLLTHPICRISVITGKLLALLAQIVLFNVICIILGIVSFAMIGESIKGEGFWLFHLAQFVMHLQIACVCFGASALLKRGSIGFGLGLAAVLYFLNIFANLSSDWDFIRFISPFGYADAAQILPKAAINIEALAAGLVYLALGAIFAYVIYSRKDVAV